MTNALSRWFAVITKGFHALARGFDGTDGKFSHSFFRTTITQGEKVNSNGGLRSHGSGNIRRTQFEPIENNHFLYFEAKTFLHGLLVVEDKLSMTYSPETRVPFLDNDLMDFALHMTITEPTIK